MLRDKFTRFLRRGSPLSKFAHIGLDCRISHSAHFEGNVSKIILEDGVSIVHHVLIHAHKDGGHIRIGARTLLKQYVQVMSYPGGHIEVGSDSSVNPFCVLYGHGGLYIGRQVRIATHTVIIPANHRFKNSQMPISEQGLERKGIRIEDNVWIGANCTICDGVTIGSGAVIGAGSVVTRDIPAMTVAVGSPARPMKSRGPLAPEAQHKKDEDV